MFPRDATQGRLTSTPPFKSRLTAGPTQSAPALSSQPWRPEVRVVRTYCDFKRAWRLGSPRLSAARSTHERGVLVAHIGALAMIPRAGFLPGLVWCGDPAVVTPSEAGPCQSSFAGAGRNLAATPCLRADCKPEKGQRGVYQMSCPWRWRSAYALGRQSGWIAEAGCALPWRDARKTRAILEEPDLHGPN